MSVMSYLGSAVREPRPHGAHLVVAAASPRGTHLLAVAASPCGAQLVATAASPCRANLVGQRRRGHGSPLPGLWPCEARR